MQRRLQAPPALPSQEMTEANPAALAERAGDTALDFLTAEAPLCDRSATYRGLQGRGLSLDPLPHPRYFCEKSAQGYEGRAVDSSGSAKE